MEPTFSSQPDDPMIGRYFAGVSNQTHRTAIFQCESRGPAMGYWLRNVDHPRDRELVYPSALRTAYFTVQDRGDHWYVWKWGDCILKSQPQRAAA